MEKKRIYIIEIGLQKFFTKDKQKAYELFELLENFKKLMYTWDTNFRGERFAWPEDLRIELESLEIDIYESKEKAQKSHEAYERAKKIGLIKKKKKKP